MSVVVITEKVDCTQCQYFELEGIEGVCTNFHEVIVDPEPLCSAFMQREE